MKEFRQDNTEGYTDDQLVLFNYDWFQSTPPHGGRL